MADYKMDRMTDSRERKGRTSSGEREPAAPRDRDGGARGRDQDGWNAGRDAAYMPPRFMPDYELLPRDDSGGPEYQPYTQQFGDGGRVTGEKAHLSVRGGRDDPKAGDEQAKQRGGSGKAVREGEGY